MRRRKLRVGLAAVVLVLAAAGALAAWPRSAPVTWDNCQRIRKGMTLAEVEALIGPPGYSKTGPVEYSLPQHKSCVLQEPWVEGRPEAYWLADAGFAVVYFDDAGRVADFSFIPGRRVAQRPLDDLVWRVSHRWRLWRSGDMYPADCVRIDPSGCPIPGPE